MTITSTQHLNMPYGTEDLTTKVRKFPDDPRRVHCYVRGCEQGLRVPRRGFKGDVCPIHGIRCHHSSAGATYAYAEATRNIIASPRAFGEEIIGHSFKYESHRLGLERSEDALSWNVFRSLQEAGCLSQFAELVTGEPCDIEPFLFLWGICTTDDEFEPWDLLIEARKRFESNLPVSRPQTEPDISVFLPGKYLILIEAKFTSPNTFYKTGPRKDKSSLTLDELLAIYQDTSLMILNMKRAKSASRVYYQLWRNTVFAEWMATLDHPNTKAFHVNLVRDGREVQSAEEFHQLVNDEYRERFRRVTWKEIYKQMTAGPELSSLRQYLETKTAGLTKAFQLD